MAERTDLPANEGTVIPPCSTSRTTVPFGVGWVSALWAAGATGSAARDSDSSRAGSRIAAGITPPSLVDGRAPRPSGMLVDTFLPRSDRRAGSEDDDEAS